MKWVGDYLPNASATTKRFAISVGLKVVLIRRALDLAKSSARRLSVTFRFARLDRRADFRVNASDLLGNRSMKTLILASALALAGCANNGVIHIPIHNSIPGIKPNSEPWYCEDYEAEKEPKVVGCVSEVTGEAWNGKRYVDFCKGRKSFPRANDPWVIHFMQHGMSRANAQIIVSDNRINDCD